MSRKFREGDRVKVYTPNGPGTDDAYTAHDGIEGTVISFQKPRKSAFYGDHCIASKNHYLVQLDGFDDESFLFLSKELRFLSHAPAKAKPEPMSNLQKISAAFEAYKQDVNLMRSMVISELVSQTGLTRAYIERNFK